MVDVGRDALSLLSCLVAILALSAPVDYEVFALYLLPTPPGNVYSTQSRLNNPTPNNPTARNPPSYPPVRYQAPNGALLVFLYV